MLFNLVEAIQNWLEEHGLSAVVRLMFQLEFRSFAAVVMSFAGVLIFGSRTIRWLVRQKIGDTPEFYNAKLNEMMARKAATPTMGGILICGSVGSTVLLLADVLHNPYVRLSLVVLIWLVVLGGFDDWLKLTAARRAPGSREGLRAWEKLLFQLGIGAIAGFFLYRFGLARGDEAIVLNFPFQRTYTPGTTHLSESVVVLPLIAYVIISTLLIAGTSNAVNLTDGMDGLAGGTMMIASFAMMALCYISGDEETAYRLMFPHVPAAKELMIVSGAMAGACLGFLWFNCNPAKVFMGDTGSLPLGGMLAFIAIAIRQEVLLIVIGGVFFIEMASVIMQVGYFKWSRGKRIFRCSPIHHHYHLGGWSEQQVVTRFWVLAVILAMVAVVTVKIR
jgi:phospho-N-acetylmuramoyl-pentapeptide-transferase